MKKTIGITIIIFGVLVLLLSMTDGLFQLLPATGAWEHGGSVDIPALLPALLPLFGSILALLVALILVGIGVRKDKTGLRICAAVLYGGALGYSLYEQVRLFSTLLAFTGLGGIAPSYVSAADVFYPLTRWLFRTQSGLYFWAAIWVALCALTCIVFVLTCVECALARQTEEEEERKPAREKTRGDAPQAGALAPNTVRPTSPAYAPSATKPASAQSGFPSGAVRPVAGNAVPAQSNGNAYGDFLPEEARAEDDDWMDIDIAPREDASMTTTQAVAISDVIFDDKPPYSDELVLLSEPKVRQPKNKKKKPKEPKVIKNYDKMHTAAVVLGIIALVCVATGGILLGVKVGGMAGLAVIIIGELCLIVATILFAKIGCSNGFETFLYVIGCILIVIFAVAMFILERMAGNDDNQSSSRKKKEEKPAEYQAGCTYTRMGSTYLATNSWNLVEMKTWDKDKQEGEGIDGKIYKVC